MVFCSWIAGGLQAQLVNLGGFIVVGEQAADLGAGAGYSGRVQTKQTIVF
jgi:hypothetical protein